jgi:phosphoribosylglycinamide formyltransferase-1
VSGVHRVGWLSSGNDAEAVTLFDRGLADQHLGYEISCLALSAEVNASAVTRALVDRARQAQIPVLSVDAHSYKSGPSRDWRKRFEIDLVNSLGEHPCDVLMLSGYMWIAGPHLLDSYKMFNLHPALPGGPTGTRAQVVRELAAQGSPVAGAMVHAVTPELDQGPPIATVEFDVPSLSSESDRFQEINRRIVAVEPDLMSGALSRVASSDLVHWPLIGPVLRLHARFGPGGCSVQPY